MSESNDVLANQIDQLASQCVKCALCLPHCPTYELTQDENESPRGRIALFQAISQGELPLTTKVKNHLDQCLGCRACERVCPAHVKYGELLVQGRTLLTELQPAAPLASPSLKSRCLTKIAETPKLARALHWFLWLSEKLGLRYLASKLGITTLLQIEKLNKLLPSVPKPLPLPTFLPALNTRQGHVFLFTGCITSLSDQITLAASLFVLRRLGYDVSIPSAQRCCGAIALHAGAQSRATTLAADNMKAFVISSDPIITLATGCQATLSEYPKYFSSTEDQNTSSTFSERVVDIISFINRCSWPGELDLKPLPLKVMLHTPCTRRNVLKTTAEPELLLQKIPELTWQAFTSPHCCGAAGTYMLEHSHIAESLANNLLSELDNTAKYFITTNIGCSLHIAQQLNNLGSEVAVCHPIVLLARSLGF